MRDWSISNETGITASTLQTRTADNSVYFAPNETGYICQIVYLEASTTFVLSAYIYTNSGSSSPNARLQVYQYQDGTDYLEGTSPSDPSKLIPILTGTQYEDASLSGTDNTWTRASTAFLTGTTFAPYIIAIYNGDTNHSGFYVDDIMLHRGIDTALPYQPHVTDYFYDMGLLTEISNYTLILEFTVPTSLIQTDDSGNSYIDVFNEIDTSEEVYVFETQAADPQQPGDEVQTNFVDNTFINNIRAWRTPGNNRRITMTATPTSTLYVYYTPVSVLVVNGSLIVEGSIFADKIAANQINGIHISATSDITIGDNVNDIIRISGDDATWRLWVGNTAAATATFRVDKNGKLYATGAEISGDITITGTNIPWDSITGTNKPSDYADVTGTAIENGVTTTSGVTIDADGIHSTGKAFGDTNVGWFVGYDSGVPKLELSGTGVGAEYLSFDGTSVTSSGTFSSTSYAAPTGTTQGTGWQMTADGSLEAYGSGHTFGGPTFFTDGSFLTAIGMYLNDTSKQYPTKTDFTSDGQTHTYMWINQPYASTGWIAETAYSIGDFILEDSELWVVRIAGTTGTAEPTWTSETRSGYSLGSGTVVFVRTSGTSGDMNSWQEIYSLGYSTDGSDWRILFLNNKFVPHNNSIESRSYGAYSAIYGKNLELGVGVFGQGVDGSGVYGYSSNYVGVYGYSLNNVGSMFEGPEADIVLRPNHTLSSAPTAEIEYPGGTKTRDTNAVTYMYHGTASTGATLWSQMSGFFAGRLDSSGTLTRSPGASFTGSSLGSAVWRVTHNFGTSNYTVLATLDHNSPYIIRITAQTSSYVNFTVTDNASNPGTFDYLHFMLILD